MLQMLSQRGLNSFASQLCENSAQQQVRAKRGSRIAFVVAEIKLLPVS